MVVRDARTSDQSGTNPTLAVLEEASVVPLVLVSAFNVKYMVPFPEPGSPETKNSRLRRFVSTSANLGVSPALFFRSNLRAGLRSRTVRV